MMKKLVPLLGLVLVLAVALGSFAQPSQFKVVVHPDNPTASLTPKTVSSFLLKRQISWSAGGFKGTAVAPIDLDAKNPVREAFSQAIHGRSTTHIKRYWVRQIFKAQNVPPPEVRSDSEVLSHVRNNRGAIGYVSADASLSGVKEVLVTESKRR